MFWIWGYFISIGKKRGRNIETLFSRQFIIVIIFILDTHPRRPITIPTSNEEIPRSRNSMETHPPRDKGEKFFRTFGDFIRFSHDLFRFPISLTNLELFNRPIEFCPTTNISIEVTFPGNFKRRNVKVCVWEEKRGTRR